MNFGPEDRLVVLATGAATDIAESILLDPSICGRIEVVAMAFDGWPRGGDAWNVKNDVRAYQVLLASDAPLAVAPADVCVRHLVLDKDGAARLAENTSDAGDYLAWKLEDWIARNGELCQQTTGRLAWPVWDLSVVARLLGMAEAETRPRPRLRDDLTLDHGSAPGEVRWITAIDGERFWDEVKRLLAGTARHGGAGR
jgi:inosine-uridine nucleoside N-ribohydrolase